MSKRVLLIGHSGDMYGANRSLIKLVQVLSTEYEVFVLLPEEGILYDHIRAFLPQKRIIIRKGLYIFTRKSFKVNYLFNTIFRFAGDVFSLMKTIRRHKIDIIHTNSGVVPAPALAAKLSGKKHIWHIREWFGDFKKFWPLYSSYMTLFSDRIVCVSEAMAAQFDKRARVRVIHNGFTIPQVEEVEVSPELTHILKNSDLTLGCTSRIRLIRKGQEYLIKAVGALTQKTGKNIQIVLIGDFVPGYEYQEKILLDLIEKHELTGRVHFLGHQKNALPFYKLFDVFVLPSGEPEPFGGVVIEAMSLGLPVIGSNLGGTAEQVADGENGYLFETQNPADLALKIEKFLTDKQKIIEFGEKSVRRVETLFSLEVHRRKIHELYRSIVQP